MFLCDGKVCKHNNTSEGGTEKGGMVMRTGVWIYSSGPKVYGQVKEKKNQVT